VSRRFNPKVVIAPDKFKGSLTANEAARAMSAGVRKHYPIAQISMAPLADGGEGTVDAAITAGAEERYTRVTGPLGEHIWARWGMFRNPDGSATTAVLESAQASGLDKVTPDSRAARTAHSYGCGQLILAALEEYATEIVIGLGGSAMTDGGSGALRALGLQVLDDNDLPVLFGGVGLLSARQLDTSHLDDRLNAVRIRLAVDVHNPLHGPEGAAYVFAPQKGANPTDQDALNAALEHWGKLLGSVAPDRDFSGAGSGAAGGFPSGFLALTSAQLDTGFDLVSGLVGLEKHLNDADVLVVGEGSLDQQSLQGKAPLSAAAMATAMDIPVVAIAGQLSLSDDELAAAGIQAAASLSDIAPSTEAAMRDAAQYAEQATITALQQLARNGSLLSVPTTR